MYNQTFVHLPKLIFFLFRWLMPNQRLIKLDFIINKINQISIALFMSRFPKSYNNSNIIVSDQILNLKLIQIGY